MCYECDVVRYERLNALMCIFECEVSAGCDFYVQLG